VRVCPKKLVHCRYCRNLAPRGEMATDPHGKLLGLTQHESYCGTRTVSCTICKKFVRLREVDIHMELHKAARQQQPLPFQLCRNANCVGARICDQTDAGRLGLCQTCFGPLWTNTYDPDSRQLVSRIARRYHQQLTEGCHHAWCANKYCATGSKEKKEGTALTLALVELVQPLECLTTKTPLKEETRFYFCVDEATTRRRFLADLLIQDPDTLGYHPVWIVKALEAAREDLNEAKVWLRRHAPQSESKS
jgi:hypothetical protein